MKLWKLGPVQGSTLLLVVGVAMTVIAAGALVSNVLSIPTEVSDTPVQLTEVTVNSGVGGEMDRPALSASVVRGVTYDAGVMVNSTADVGSAELRITIEKISINATDVAVKYYDGVIWQTLGLTDAGDFLFGALPDVILNEGDGYTVILLFTFEVSGSYVTEFGMYTV